MKFLILNTLLSVATISSFVFTAQAQEDTGCYMIDSAGNFTDLTGTLCRTQQINNTPSVKKPEDVVSSERVSNSAAENVSNVEQKSCSDFGVDWDAVQAYMEKNNADYLDGDGDGFACNGRNNSGFGSLSREIWERLKNRQSRSLNESKKELTLSQVQSIIGFRGAVVSSSANQQTLKWRNYQNPYQFIEATFLNGEMKRNSGSF